MPCYVPGQASTEKSMCQVRFLPFAARHSHTLHNVCCSPVLLYCCSHLSGNNATQPHTAKCVLSHEHRAVQRCILFSCVTRLATRTGAKSHECCITVDHVLSV